MNYSQERKAFYGKKEHRGDENQTKVSTEKKECTLWRGYFWVLRAVILDREGAFVASMGECAAVAFRSKESAQSFFE